MTETALVYGVAVAGAAVARALAAHGHRVVVADDAPDDTKRALAHELGSELVECPDDDTIRRLVRDADLVAPAPGVPETHDVVRHALAADVPLRTEIDLAYEWERDRPGGPRPMVAITGTDGKTTTTVLTAALLAAGGLRTAAVGNTEVPFVAALDDDVDAFAVECSSFRLSWIRSFRAEAAIWLNLAPDHQNWHTSMASYEEAKANVWRHQRTTDVAVGWTGDRRVMARLAAAPGRHVTFGLDAGDHHVIAAEPTSVSGVRTGGASGSRSTASAPEGRLFADVLGPYASVASLRRRFPHDVSNALAAAAACLEAGLVGRDAIDAGLAEFRVPPHRIEPLGELDGAQWYNDSKATSPHAALTAIRSFDSIVLIAGGRNKGLDLAALASEASRVRSVVAVGESAGEIEAAFAGLRPTVRATSMGEAVELARLAARPRDAVLLSPACASYDWYPTGGYPARGDDFRRLFHAQPGAPGEVSR
ncbi:MAG: UDP-N-acetylmuramoyl-L-alanine--D-glutamate ligase [Acidimicrobiales bacterium]|nr:UDP-N-acetylmuramoyl-L-alanine--D-glutamate ligase [Acidimicrobiales bacterium]MCB9394447.1 UDP-N-acetylmuramoyl-L-alanine--D-glutamate ligase [Acidimicrobiaceae bacterium]